MAWHLRSSLDFLSWFTDLFVRFWWVDYLISLRGQNHIKFFIRQRSISIIHFFFPSQFLKLLWGHSLHTGGHPSSWGRRIPSKGAWCRSPIANHWGLIIPLRLSGSPRGRSFSKSSLHRGFSHEAGSARGGGFAVALTPRRGVFVAERSHVPSGSTAGSLVLHLGSVRRIPFRTRNYFSFTCFFPIGTAFC